MTTQKNQQRGSTRRDFLRDAGLLGVTLASGGILAACGSPEVVSENPPASTTPEPTPGAGVPDVMTADLASKKWSFEIPPDPIPESEIANTVEADVIIVGSGISGLVTANSAAEHGAKVVLISASSGPIYRGGSFHAPWSKAMEAAGLERYDVDRFFRREFSNASYRVDQDKWYKFYNNAETAINWLIDKMEAAGYRVGFEKGNWDPDFGPMETPVGSHGFYSSESSPVWSIPGLSAEAVAKRLEVTAKESGVQIIYKTVAKQLVRENNNTGRVTAVIAQGEDGKYTKYVGHKGIVLATGDFSADREMMAKYCPWAMPLLDDTGSQGYDTTFKFGGLYKGDGHKMALWVGAAWQKTVPNAPMIQGSWVAANQPYGSHRGLVVNKLGYRYANEDMNGPLSAIQQMRQPDMAAYCIWSHVYAEQGGPWYRFGMDVRDEPIPPEQVRQEWEQAVEDGTMVKGDTVEEVIQKLGLPLETTLATVRRYNELCRKGVDEDFHKRPELLVPIEEGPFYGAFMSGLTFLTVCGGLRTNANMQVCDENDNPIPGLYCVGIMVGDTYANIYNFLVAGHNYGMNCLTFGYLTGKAIAEGTV